MKPLLTVLKFAAITAIIVGYVAFMGSTGFCPTCVAMVDWATGRSANASVVPATAAVASRSSLETPGTGLVPPTPWRSMESSRRSMDSSFARIMTCVFFASMPTGLSSLAISASIL